MGGSKSLRSICIDHNYAISQRATLQQKLFVLDYIRANNCTISKAVKHFISTGCSFKISVSTVSDWKLKEASLRDSVQMAQLEDGQMNKRPTSALLSKRLKLQFRYPLIVENLEKAVSDFNDKEEEINETVLIAIWKDLARRYQGIYNLSEEFIEKGPSKGFMYRFKVRNGIASHERKIEDEINNEKEVLDKFNHETETEVNEEAEDQGQEQEQPPSKKRKRQKTRQEHESESGSVPDPLPVPNFVTYDPSNVVDMSIYKISEFLNNNSQFFEFSHGAFNEFLKYFQQERLTAVRSLMVEPQYAVHNSVVGGVPVGPMVPNGEGITTLSSLASRQLPGTGR